MSTRRARIKAVASLPVRRKNADNSNVDNNNPKQTQPQESLEKLTKSPKTPQSFIANNNEEKSPSDPFPPKATENSKESSKACDIEIPQEPIFITPNETVHKNITLHKTPKLSEKVSVITPTPFLKSQSSNVFVSPIRRDNAVVKSVASPISPRILSLRTEVIVQNSQSPQTIETLTLPCSKIIQSKETTLEALTANKDYNPPSVPESLTDETGMDGIVPLQSTHNLPKPIAVLKDEIISENAEVLFDPIVPLPSPSKVRPKLRPAPRLNTIRRNSIQGSASESEDESRRSLLVGGTSTPAPARLRHESYTSHSTLHSAPNKEINRVRNDSVCSGVSQATVQPLHAASPLKEKNVTKCRRQEASRRMAAMRRRRETVKRDTLTMYDLIFYNPTTNPLVSEKDSKAKEVITKDALEKEKEVEEEEDEDDPPSESEAAPVPQITIGPNGEIILDRKSLVIKQTKSERKLSSNVIHETYRPIGSGGRYTRQARTAEWSTAETIRFYRALATAGTDFTLMAPLFPDRSRRDLKIKFKKEEKINGAQVDKALRSATTWDVLNLQKEFREEREEARRKAEKEKERLEREQLEERKRLKQYKALGVRRSKAAKVLKQIVSDEEEEINTGSTADQIIIRALEKKARNRKQATKEPKEIEQSPEFAMLTCSHRPNTKNLLKIPSEEMATMSPRVDPKSLGHFSSVMPKNFEIGSLVVLTVNDPKSPTKKMLQTYIAREGGTLTPVALPSTLLNTVVGYMKNGTPKSNVSTSSSPHVSTPHSVVSNESRDSVSRTSVTSGATSVIQINPSPIKRQRLSSYTITQL